jgi:hypothetical protein
MASFLITGCNMAGDMSEMFQKQDMVSKAIKEKTGLETQVGWNMNNGFLTQVTVSFDAEQVRDKTVLYLESIAREAVAASFKSTPLTLNVQIVFKAKKRS